MKLSRFDLLMTSIDDSLLEEALQSHNIKRHRAKIIVQIAACFCLIAGIWFLLRPLTRPSIKAPAIAKDLQILNYDLPVLETLPYSIDYALYDYREKYEAPLAEAVLTSAEGGKYIVRSLKTISATDISGLTSQEAPLIWTYGPLEFQLCSNGIFSWLNWHSAEAELQYCISTEGTPAILLQTATVIVETLGYNMAISPDEATDVIYQVFFHENLTVAETSFLYEGIRYQFRMAATADVNLPFADISGTDTGYETHISSELLWCPAEIFYNEDGSGKIIWFDIVPGLLYSLSADRGINEAMLLTMAESLFHPAQEGD